MNKRKKRKVRSVLYVGDSESNAEDIKGELKQKIDRLAPLYQEKIKKDLKYGETPYKLYLNEFIYELFGGLNSYVREAMLPKGTSIVYYEDDRYETGYIQYSKYGKK